MAPPNTEIISDTASKSTENTINFPKFDIVSTDPFDHFYFNDSKHSTNTNTASRFHKKIMQEWKVLDANLPETIFVRVYETRISLVRAAIVGARGTPYHDSLFFFDIFLPSDYPFRPPHVHYHSFGFRINPNLYQNGRVCLSLLNTWIGNKSEKWDRKQSTLLQVLLSIQALVLNEKPYFNEPGYGSSRGNLAWQKAAVAYNEEVFVLCCKSALRHLRKPPANFEALVAIHFRERAVAILSACDAYRSGVPVAGSGSGLRLKKEVSIRFKGMIEKVYGDLVNAFAKNGASVGKFVKQLVDENEAKAREAMEKKVKKQEEAKRRREKRKKAKEALKKKVMAIVEKILVGAGLKNSSGNEQVKVMNSLVGNEQVKVIN